MGVTVEGPPANDAHEAGARQVLDSTDLWTITERLAQLNRYTDDGSHWIARVEIGPDGAPLISFFQELAKERVPEFLRPTWEIGT